MGRTSLWMFPIYGMGVLLPGIVNTADRWLTGLSAFPEAGTDRISPPARLVRHGLMDMVLIFTAEYVTGTILKHFNVPMGLFHVARSYRRGDPAGFWAPVVLHRASL